MYWRQAALKLQDELEDSTGYRIFKGNAQCELYLKSTVEGLETLEIILLNAEDGKLIPRFHSHAERRITEQIFRDLLDESTRAQAARQMDRIRVVVRVLDNLLNQSPPSIRFFFQNSLSHFPTGDQCMMRLFGRGYVYVRYVIQDDTHLLFEKVDKDGLDVEKHSDHLKKRCELAKVSYSFVKDLPEA